MKKTLLLGLGLIALSSGAFAEDCSKLIDPDNVTLSECIDQAETESKKELISALNSAYAKLSTKSDRDSFNIAQKAFLNYRNAQCAYIASQTGGSTSALDIANCAVQLNKQRVATLKNH